MSSEALTAEKSPSGYFADRLGVKFCVRDKTGGIVRRGYSYVEEAQNAIDVLERQGRIIERPCMHCGETVKSEGPHHRLCPTCRATPVSPYAP